MSPTPFRSYYKATRNSIENQLLRALILIFINEKTATLDDASRGVMHVPDNEAMERAVFPHYMRAVELGIDEAVLPLVSFDVGFHRQVINNHAIAYAERHMGQLIQGINETTRKKVAAAFKKYQESDRGVDYFSELLEPIFGAARAEMIAVTETTNAIAASQEIAWMSINEQAGKTVVKGKQWLTANDDRVCPICAPLGGLVFVDTAQPASITQQNTAASIARLGQPFIHPGGGGAAEQYGGTAYMRPPAHPRCRCDLRPIVKI